MKGTQEFEKAIREYLDGRAAEDGLFAKTYAKEGKSIKECCAYIIDQAYQSGVSGMADEEVYSLAAHYYDEDGLSQPKSHNCSVIVNRHIELTEAEKEEARQRAIKDYEQECQKRLLRQAERSKPTAKAKPAEETQPTLFDFEEL